MAIIAQYNLTSDFNDSVSNQSLNRNLFSENYIFFSTYGTYNFSTDNYLWTIDSPFQNLNGDFTIDFLIEFSQDQIDTMPYNDRQCIFRSSYSDINSENWEETAYLDIDVSYTRSAGIIEVQINNLSLTKDLFPEADRPYLITLIKKDDELFLFIDGIKSPSSIDLSGFVFGGNSIFQIGYTEDPQNSEPLFPNCSPFYGKIKNLMFQDEDVLDIDVTDTTNSFGEEITFNPFLIEHHDIGNNQVLPFVPGYFNYNVYSNYDARQDSSESSIPYSNTQYYSITGENPFSQIGSNDFCLAISCTIQQGLDTQSIVSYGYNGCENFCIKAITVENPGMPSGLETSIYFSGGITVSLAEELIGTSIDIVYARRSGVVCITIDWESKFAYGELVNNTNYGKFGTLSYGQSYDPISTGDQSFSGIISSVKFLSIFSYTGATSFPGKATTRTDNRYTKGGGNSKTTNLVTGYFDKSLIDQSGFSNNLKTNNATGLSPIIIDNSGITNFGVQIGSYNTSPIPAWEYGTTIYTKADQNCNYLQVNNSMLSPSVNVTGEDFVINLKVNFGTQYAKTYSVLYNNLDYPNPITATVLHVIGGLLFSFNYPSKDQTADYLAFEIETCGNPQIYQNKLDPALRLNSTAVHSVNLKVRALFFETGIEVILKSSIMNCFDGQDHDITLIKQNNELVLLIDGMDVPPINVTANNGWEITTTYNSQGGNVGGGFFYPVFRNNAITFTAVNGPLQNRASVDPYECVFFQKFNAGIRFGGTNRTVGLGTKPTLFNTKFKGLRIIKSMDDITDWDYFDLPTFEEIGPNIIDLEYCDMQPVPEGITIIGGGGNSTDTEQPGDRPNESSGLPFDPPHDEPPKVCGMYLCPGESPPDDVILGENEVFCVKPYCPPVNPGDPVKLAQTTLGKKLFLELDAAPTSGSGYNAAIGSVALVDVSGVGKLYTKTGTGATAWTEGGGGSTGVSQSYVDFADNALSGRITTTEGNINTLNGQVSTVNGQISTLNGQVSTIDGEISTINGQIATLQSNSSSYATTTYVDNNTAKKDLSNLVTTALAVDLQPASNEATNLGTVGARFGNIRAKNAYFAEIRDASDVPILDATTRQIKNASGVVLMDFSNSTISFNSKKLTSVADPTSAQDVATKNYVDNNTATARLIDASAANTTTLATTDQRYMDVQNGTLGTNHTILLPSNATLPVGTKFQITNSSNTVVIVQNSSGATITNIPKGFSGVFPSRNLTEGWFGSVSQNSGSVFSSVVLTANTTTIDLAQGNQFYVENNTSGAVTFTLTSTGPSGIVNGQKVTVVIKNTHASATMTPTVNGIACPAVTAGAAIALTFMKINGTIYKIAQQNPAS